MPKPVVTEVSFEEFLKSIANLPKDVITATWKTGKTPYENNFVLLQARVKAPDSGISDTDLVFLEAEGPEAVADVKYVQTQVNLADFAKDPKKALLALGQKTVEQIADLEEIQNDKRAYITDQLTKGYTYLEETDHQGVTHQVSLTKPTNSVLSGLKHVYPSGTGDLPYYGMPIKAGPTGPESEITLLKNTNSNPNATPEWEDRKVAEEGRGAMSQYKSYARVAGELRNMSDRMEDRASRAAHQFGTQVEFNRAVMSELGVDLDRTLNTSTHLQHEINANRSFKTPTANNQRAGRLHLQMRADHWNIDTVLADPAKVAGVLGVPLATYNSYTPATKSFLGLQLRIEDFEIRNSYLSGSEKPADILKIWSDADIPLSFGGIDYNHPGYMRGHAYRTWLRDDFDRERQRLATEASLMYDVNRRQILRDVAATTPGASDPKLARLRSAEKAKKIGQDLYWASTGKEMLESIENGSFLRGMIIQGGLRGLMPLASNKQRSPKMIADLFGPDNLPRIKDISKYAKSLPHRLGIAFEEQDGKLLGIPALKAFQKMAPSIMKESYVSVEWVNQANLARGFRTWSMTFVSARDGAGLFGATDSGIFSTLKILEKVNKNPLLAGRIPLPADLLSGNCSQLSDFATNILHGWENRFMGTAHALPDPVYELLAEHMFGIGGDAEVRAFANQAVPKFQSAGKLLFDKLGVKGLADTERWEFLNNLFKQGKHTHFINTNAGILNNYNRVSNHIRNYIYKNLIFGDALVGIPVLGKGMQTIAGFMRRFGMSDDVGLTQAVSRWKFVRQMKLLGKMLELSGNPASSGWQQGMAGRYFARVIGPKLASLLMKFGARFGFLMRSVGMVVGNVAGLVAALVGYIVTSVGQVVWAFSKGLLTGNIVKGWNDAVALTKKKLETLKKAIIYPILMLICCCAGLIALVVFVIIIIGSVLAPYVKVGNYVDSLLYGPTQSKMITLDKTATMTGTGIKYTITIKNISTVPVKVAKFEDKLTQTFSCDAGGGTVEYFDGPIRGSFVGTTVIPRQQQVFDAIAGVAGGDPILAPGQTSRPIQFTLEGITTEDSTYTNTATAWAEGDEVGKAASDMVSTQIGKGGCTECPGGWPISTPISVSQGRQGGKSHGGIEAVDFAKTQFSPVFATHSGRVRIVSSDATCTANTYHAGSDCPNTNASYGCYIEVESMDKKFRTIYAHLTESNYYGLTSGSIINRGSPIGRIGNSGCSSGPHLHYQFSNNTYKCFPGEPLRLEKLERRTIEYVPETICSGSCTQSF